MAALMEATDVELELRTRRHQQSDLDSTCLDSRHDDTVEGGMSSRERALSSRDVGTQTAVASGNLRDPSWVDVGVDSSPLMLGDDGSPELASRYDESLLIRHRTEMKRLQKELEEVTQSRNELLTQCGELRAKQRELCTCQHGAVLHIGDELSDQDTDLPLQDQVKKLKRIIEKLKMEKLPLHLAEAMEQCTSLHGINTSGQGDSLLNLQHMNETLIEKIAVLQVQLATYEEDFTKERDDRSKAVQAVETMKEKIVSLEIAVEDTEQALGIQTKRFKEIVQHSRMEVDKVKAELEAAREELAVKVAQVKQYQKQVEVYKQEAAAHMTREQIELEVGETLIIEIEKLQEDNNRVHRSTRTPRVSGDLSPGPHQLHGTGLNAPTKDEEDASVGTGDLHAQEVFPHQDNVETSSVPAAGNNREGRLALSAPVLDSSQTCVAGHTSMPHHQVSGPSPIPKQNQASASSHHGDPSSHVGTQFVVGSVDDGSNLPPPVILPSKKFPPLQEDAVSSSQTNLPRATHASKPYYVAKDNFRTFSNEGAVGGGVAPDKVCAPGLLAPLDPNLQCICCQRVFRKGEIQIFKQHVTDCMRAPYV